MALTLRGNDSTRDSFLAIFSESATADTDTTDDNDMPIWDCQFTCIIEDLFLSAKTKIVFNL